MAAAYLPGNAAPRILVHGHRGARAVFPENTLPAFEYAINAGADVLELDVAVTKDDVLVVSHDPTMNPEICSGPRPGAIIRELTFPELRQYDCGAIQNTQFPKQQPVPGTRVPALDEVLSLSDRGKFQYNIETKSFPDKPQYTPTPEKFSQLLLALIRKHQLESRVMVQSFDFRTLHAMKKLAPEIRLVALWEGEARSFVSIAKEADVRIVSPHYPLITPKRVREAHAARLQVVPWTPNEPVEWQKLIDAGADAIITDDPARLIAYLKQHRLR